MQVRVECIVDALRPAGRVKHLIGEGQADGVEAKRAHLVKGIPPEPLAEAGRGEGTRFQAGPVDAAEPHGMAVGVADHPAVGVQIEAIGGEQEAGTSWPLFRRPPSAFRCTWRPCWGWDCARSGAQRREQSRHRDEGGDCTERT